MRLPTARAAGFTLLEVLVALLVLATVVTVALQLVGAGLRLAGSASEQVAATILASAKLAELSVGALEEGSTDGAEGEFRWTRRVTVDESLLPRPDAGQPDTTRLARVTIEVSWGKGRRIELATLRAWGVKP